MPGPTTEAVRERWRRNSASRIIVSLFERRAAGLYHNTAAVLDGRQGLHRQVPQDAHPRRSALLREVLFHARRSRFQDLRHGQGPIGRADLLGPVVSRKPRASRRMQGAESCSIRLRSAGTRRKRTGSARAQHGAWETMQRSHAMANGCFVVAVNRTGFEPDPAGEGGIEFWGQSFIAAPDGRIVWKAPAGDECVAVEELDLACRNDDGAAGLAVLPRPAHRRLRGPRPALPRRRINGVRLLFSCLAYGKKKVI